MSKKESVTNGQYTDEFKMEAVRLGESIGGNQAAERLGIPESSLWNWIKLSRATLQLFAQAGIFRFYFAHWSPLQQRRLYFSSYN